MVLLALTAALLAAGPPATKAVELQRQKSWDDLYLAYSAVSPEGYSDGDRAKIARALEAGCRALEKEDAVIAYSLAETAAKFNESSDGLLCLARSARASDQRGSAEAALRSGAEKYPKITTFSLELGSLLLSEGDAEGALTALQRVPVGAKDHGKAQGMIRNARQKLAADESVLKQAEALERRIELGQPPKGGEVATAAGSSGPSLSFTSAEGPGGMRTRGNSRFTIKYFNNARDFGQRAEYEGQIVAALDEADAAAKRILGITRSKAVDVVLYSREEFAAHFNAQVARRVAGLYSMDSIRINDAAELTRQNRATLVHEYVHAIVDDLTDDQRLPLWVNEGIAEYVEWRYLGQDGPGAATLAQLRGLAKNDALPKLRDMDRSAPINSSAPHLAYATSAIAVRVLLSQGGVDRLIQLMKDVGSGASFPDALMSQYGRSLEQLEGDVRDELARR